MNSRRLLVGTGLLVMVLAAGCRSGASKARPTPARPPVGRATPTPTPAPVPTPSVPPLAGTLEATSALVPPTVRIGFMVDVARVSIGGADSGMQVLIGPKRVTAQRLTFELANPAQGAAVRFRVQAASLSDLPAAEQA